MDPLSLSASIAGLVTVADAIFRGAYRYAKAIKDAPETIRQLADETQSLAGVLHRLSNLASVLEIDSSTNTIRLRHVIACRRLLARVEKKVATASSDIESPRLRDSLKRRALWPFSDKEMKELLADLQRHNTALSLALSADTMDTLLRSLASQSNFNQSLHGTIASIEDKVGETLEITTRIHLSDRRQQVLNFFGAGNPQLALDVSRQLRHEGTGEWLLENEAFQRWMTTPNQNLWLSGIPGAGKTVLAGLMIEELIDRSDPTVGVAFFFCDFKDAQTHAPLEILGSLASQLARQNDAAFEILESYFDELKPSRQLPRGPSLARLEDVLHSIGEKFQTVYLVVDGVDECGDSMQDVAEALLRVARRQTTVCLSVLSRDERPIRDALTPECTHLEIEAQREDVRLYTAAELEFRVRSKRLRLSNPSLKDDILHVLVDENGGMFRWVKCQLDYLCDLPTDAKRRAALRSLPPTLKETYERILGRLEEKGEAVCEFVQRTLHLIYGAKPSLTIRQLCEAVSVEDNMSLEDGCVDQDTILEYCGSLVRKSILCSECKEIKLEFAHFTVGEFLVDASLLENSRLARYHVSQSRSSKALALSALRYVFLADFSRTPEATEKEIDHIAARNKEHPFYEYAALVWPLYAPSLWEDEEFSKYAHDLFQSRSPTFLAWAAEFGRHTLLGASEPCHELAERDPRSCQSESFIGLVSFILRQSFTPFHMAAALGLRPVCEAWMQRPGAINSDSLFGTPLECTVWGVACLSDVFCPFRPEYKRMPSFLAGVLERLDKSRPQLLELLLQNGAELPTSSSASNAQCSLFEGALNMCVATNNFDILSHLLVAGLEPNGRDLDIFGRDKPRSATWRQRLILREGEELMSSGNNWDAFLLTIEKISLDSDSPNIQELYRLAFDFTAEMTGGSCSATRYVLDSSTRRPLESAILAIRADDTIQLSKLLEQSEFDPSAPINSTGATLMHIAVRCCSAECLKVLLKCERIVPKPDNMGSLPILSCRGDKNAEALRLLLDNGCDANVRDQNGVTVWHFAASDGANDLIRILGEKVTNILDALAVVDNYGETPLQVAFRNSNEDTILLLLDYCDGDSKKWWPGLHPILHAAAFLGSHTVLRKLLDIGIPAKVLDTRGVSSFHFLNANASLAFVKLLKTLSPEPANLFSVARSARPMESFGRSVKASSGLERYLDIFKELLPDGIGTTEVDGKHSWEQFCAGIFAERNYLCSPEWLSVMLSQLEATGIFSDYETTRNQSVIVPFAARCVKALDDNGKLDWSVGALSKLFELTKLPEAAVRSDAVVFLLISSIRYDTALFSLLDDKGVDVHQRLGGYSAMEMAFDPTMPVPYLTFERLVRHLNKENVNTPNPTDSMALIHRLGYNPRHASTASDVDKRLAALIDIGADTNLKDGNGWAALHYHILVEAESGTLGRMESKVCQLLDAGADLSIAHKSGYDAALLIAGTGAVPLLRRIRDLESQQAASVNWRNFNWERICNPGKATIPAINASVHLEGCNAVHLASFWGHTGTLGFYISELGLRHLLKERALMEVNTDKGMICLLPIHLAAMGGHASTVEYLIKQGSDMDSLDDTGGWTPLKIAICHGQVSAARALIDLGARWIPAESSLLGYAIQCGHEGIITYVELLQDTKDPVVAYDRTDLETAKSLRAQLHRAISLGDIETCKDLLEKGCSLNDVSPRCGGCPPLVAVLSEKEDYRFPDVIKWLLENGASTSAVQCPRHHFKSPEPDSVLMLVARNRRLNPVLSLLLSSYLAEGNTWFNQDRGPVYAAAQAGNTVGLEIMLEHFKLEFQKYSTQLNIEPTMDKVLYALVNQRVGRSKGTPLHIALRTNRVGTIVLLLRNGADVHLSSKPGDTALHVAAASGSIESVDLLLRHGAKIEARGYSSQTPLMTALVFGKLDVAKRLIECGADIRCRDEDGNGMLWHCMHNKEGWKTHEISMVEIFLQLLDSGLDRNDMHALAGSAVLLRMLQIRQLRRLVISRRISLEGCQPIAWEHKGWSRNGGWWRGFDRVLRVVDRQTLRNLLGVNPLEGRRSPLTHATMCGSVEGMQHLIHLGADIEFDDVPYGTALMVACEYGFLEPVKFLVRLGARLAYSSSTKRCYSALHIAKNYPDVVTWLLVGRFRDQPRIGCSPSAADDLGGSSSECMLRPWSGIRKLEVPLQGPRARRADESALDWLVRLRDMAREFRGEVAISPGILVL